MFYHFGGSIGVSGGAYDFIKGCIINLRASEKRLISNTIFLYVMQISGHIFPLLTFPYITRVLGPDIYGMVIFSNAVIVYFQMFVDFGFILSATRECAVFRDSPDKLSEILSGVIQAKFVLFLMGFIILLCCCAFLDIFSGKKLYLILSYISVGLSILLPDFFFRGIEKMSIITYRVIFSKLIYTVCIFAFVRARKDFLFIPFSLLISNSCAVFLTWYELIRRIKIRIIFVPAKTVFNFLKDSSVFFLSRIAASAYSTANTILLGFKFQSYDLAQYGAANTLSSSIKSMFSPIADSIYPYMVAEKNYKLIKRILLILMPLICLGCVILFVFSKPIIGFICGKDYAGAVPVFRMMIPYIILTLPSYIFGYPVLGALGKIHIANTSVMAGAGFQLIGLLVLYLTKRIDFFSVIVLTGLTEVIVLSIRIFSCVKTGKI
jgi:PST family polysaccharide transporter